MQIPPVSKQEIILQLNRQLESAVQYMKGKDQVLQHRLKKNVEKFENKIAIEYGEAQLTYREMDKRSDSIARQIRTKRIPGQTFIGILTTNRMNLICTAVAILKAGCVFVPLSPTLPRARLEVMIESTGIRFICTDNAGFRTFIDSNIFQGRGGNPQLIRVDEGLSR